MVAMDGFEKKLLGTLMFLTVGVEHMTYAYSSTPHSVELNTL
jgi:hypothetical protein